MNDIAIEAVNKAYESLGESLENMRELEGMYLSLKRQPPQRLSIAITDVSFARWELDMLKQKLFQGTDNNINLPVVKGKPATDYDLNGPVF